MFSGDCRVCKPLQRQIQSPSLCGTARNGIGYLCRKIALKCSNLPNAENSDKNELYELEFYLLQTLIMGLHRLIL